MRKRYFLKQKAINTKDLYDWIEYKRASNTTNKTIKQANVEG